MWFSSPREKAHPCVHHTFGLSPKPIKEVVGLGDFPVRFLPLCS